MKLRCPKCGSNKKLNLELGGWVGPYFRCQDCKFGSTIIDIFHLPTDEYVLNNLKAKRDLQKQSMNDIKSLFKEI